MFTKESEIRYLNCYLPVTVYFNNAKDWRRIYDFLFEFYLIQLLFVFFPSVLYKKINLI